MLVQLAAGKTFQNVSQPSSAFTGPADLLGGVADNQGEFRDVLIHYRSGTNKTVSPKGGSAHNGCIGTDGGALF
jgi:hypothetical protein